MVSSIIINAQTRRGDIVPQTVGTAPAGSPPERHMVYLAVEAAVSIVMLDDEWLTFYLTPQAEVEGLPYRIDLLIEAVYCGDERSRRRLAFECDGLEYHGDQKAFARDRKRDRDLAAIGLDTIRFTAKEIDRDPLPEMRRILDRLQYQSYCAVAVVEPLGDGRYAVGIPVPAAGPGS